MKNIKRGTYSIGNGIRHDSMRRSGKTENAGKAAEKNHFIEAQPLPGRGSPADINAKEFADNVKAADS